MENLLTGSAHLMRELGQDLYEALINPKNTGKVRKLAEELYDADIPAEITVGGRTYELVHLPNGRGGAAKSAKSVNANLGQEDGENFLANQKDIPSELWHRVTFLFTDWRHPESKDHYACLYYNEAQCKWSTSWRLVKEGWYFRCRGLHRKS